MVLPTVTATLPWPWVLQDLSAFSGGRLPSRQVVISLSRAVHWQWGEHPWSRHWVTPASVGRELGAEAPLVLESKEPQSSLGRMDPLWVGITSGSPLVMFGSLALPRLKISNKAGLLVAADLLQTDPGNSRKGTLPTGGK